MSTGSIFSGSLVAVPASIQVNTEAIEEVVATLKDAVLPTAEYTPFKRTTVPSLVEILDIYPVVEAIASRLTFDDFLSLSLVSRDIHQALGQSTTKSYWKHLLGKCLPLLCHANHPERGCSDIQRCLRCKKGVCGAGTNALALLVDSAERRVRYVCKGCVLTGRNALLSESPTLFGAHTINQLTAGRKWMREDRNPFYREDYMELKVAQEADVTFCPNRVDLFDMQRLPSVSSVNYLPPAAPQSQDQHQSEPVDRKIVAWQTIRRQSTYDPTLDRIREFEQSRCMCLQAGLSLPLCYDCSMIGTYNDWKYRDFARHNTGCCECGTMVVDFPGEKEGEIIPGAIWNPQKDTLAGVQTTVTGTDGEGKGAPPPEETIEGLCGWCGFRVYQQKGKRSHLPETDSDWLSHEQKRTQVTP